MTTMDSLNNLLSPGYGRQPHFSNQNPSPILPEYRPTTSGGVTGGAASGGGNSSWLSMDSFLGNAENGFQGWGVPAAQIGTGLFNSFMGMKNYGLAKDMLGENKRQFNLNYGNQRQMVNNQLEDRQRARVASNPGAYQSVGQYMDQNRIR